ncbi:MAG: NAD(P)/FAD-dependent oxidoreductase [Lachnospiraceae bacterium]|nr:NAD(P)/FAD-dependent oxidoreductase [Lachnospiraceae bacterium]
MKIIIIGGGAAGMFAAIAASKNENNEILILEKNEKLGKKLFITGKGRCNVTNDCDKETFFKNIVSNPKFLYSSFNNFNNYDLMSLIEENGCKLKIERGNRVFPVSDKSSDIIKALKKAITKKNIKIIYNAEVTKIIKNDATNDLNTSFIVLTHKNEKFNCDKVVVATGGLSYSSTGSTGDGYRFARQFNINTTKTMPSLVPFNIREVDECLDLQGLTLKNVSIKVLDRDNDKKVLYKDFGEMLFTHFGVSGPIILSASAYIKDVKDSILSIDLKPALTFEELDKRLQREIEVNNKKKIKSLLLKLLPSSFVNVFLKRLDDAIKKDNKNLNVNIEDLNCNEINKEIRYAIINLLKDFRFVVLSKRGFEEAVVTKGGIDVKEVDPKTMESKSIKGLYFVGEVLDIDALTGGFNITIAATTGFTAGKNLCEI